MRCWLLKCLLFPGLVVAVSLVLPQAQRLHAQQMTKRLMLKDGSYQSVVKYEVQGDRVHYYSGKLTTKIEETPEEREEREQEEANSPEIAPGLHLPGSGGVFLFDQFQDKPELSEILQNGSEVKKSAGKNTLRSAINPLAGAKQDFELKGVHAQIQSHVARPTIYVDIDEGTGNDIALSDRFRIARATVKNGSRVVGNVKVSATGKVSEQSTLVPVKIEKLGTGEWTKVTPVADLTPGEYALIEMLGPNEMNLYVWDFGVNPNAPANPNTWQPAANASPAR